ncbi:deltex-like protein (macronuclear) [Tetrahymena thermophila SB210]|uniref:RING-type E3 ubiquitin transferase n=1 Tax=Tetrahymena thermophila (strain SB210) TaxID=312017 RepID=I7MMD5_TETTS|nr:deltex-like protein [Tetrahymena thermophila SB210]EAS04646.2 deltex-like protein [Tetrahymena thermophila SB210]|eukprot:XP_001024891.2 deltex-like protein [Tetrahymena thermophila SB210]
MIAETISEQANKGVNLWEKLKIKIKAVQSFLRLQNDMQKQEDSILNKRKNPFQDQENVDQNLDKDLNEAVCKKLRDNNGDPKDQIIEDQQYKTQSSNNLMEVLNEGRQDDDNLQNDSGDDLNNLDNQVNQNDKSQVLIQQSSNNSNLDLNFFVEDNQDYKNYSTSNLKGFYKEQSSQDFKIQSSQMSFNNEKENKTNNEESNKIFKNISQQNNGENYNEKAGIQIQQQKDYENIQQYGELDSRSKQNDDKQGEELAQYEFEQKDEENKNIQGINQEDLSEDDIFQDKEANKSQEDQEDQQYDQNIPNDELYQLFGTQSKKEDENEQEEKQQELEDESEYEDEQEEEDEEKEEDKEEDNNDDDGDDNDWDDDEEDDDDNSVQNESNNNPENEFNQDENAIQKQQKKKQREYEDSLIKQENIYISDAIIEDDNTNVINQGTNYISFELNEQENIITIKICTREYKIDLNKEIVKNNDKLVKIINDMADLIEQMKIKQNEKIQELMKITDHNQFTAIEYYLMKTIDDIFRQERGIQNQQWQEEICCICQCDLFENIDNYSQEDFLKQLQTSSDEDPINLVHCESHYFHKSCLQMMIQSTYIKCPVCSKIYGVMIGDQPPGTMSIYLDKYTSCDGYPDISTIVIEMRLNSTQKNGNHVPSTSRIGYLPNTEEARKILEMFKIAFKRRLLYTIGKSVTTGKDNRIIWNGVHFKTNTYGGSAQFGYPDPTYFQRVTQELSLKGIYPKD